MPPFTKAVFWASSREWGRLANTPYGGNDIIGRFLCGVAVAVMPICAGSYLMRLLIIMPTFGNISHRACCPMLLPEKYHGSEITPWFAR